MPSDSVQMSSSSPLRVMQSVCLTVAALPILILVLVVILGLLVGALLEETYRWARYGRWRGRRLPLNNTSYTFRQDF